MKKIVKQKTIIWFASICLLSLCNIFDIKAQSKTEREEEENAQVDSACGGTERWAEKVLADALASTVNFTPIQSTVASLVALATPTPNPYMTRQAGVEDKVYQITCNITIKKSETDADYHLVLSDGTHTLIGEIPNPVCSTAVASAHVIQYTTARNFIDAHIASGNVSNVNIGMVTVTGVPFVDPPHGQTGAAPNNLELHPILDIHFSSSTAVPKANFIASPTIFCADQPITLTDNSSNSPTSWSWTMTGGTPPTSSQQSPSVTFSTIGTHTVTLTSTNSHGTSNPISQTVTVNASPSVPTVSLSGSTLTSSSTTNNQWYYNGIILNGFTGQTYNATVSGAYTVVVTNSYGCSTSSAPTIFTTTGISSVVNNEELSIVPNPTNGSVIINLIDKSEHFTVEIFNDLGQLVYTEKVNDYQKNSNKSIDISTFPAGNYLFKIHADENVFIKKILLHK